MAAPRGGTPHGHGVVGIAATKIRREAGRMPLVALTVGLQVWEHTRGPRRFALRRANEALQIAAHTPLGRLLPQPAMDDGAEAEAALIAEAARESHREAPATPRPPAPEPPAPSPAAVEAGAPGAVTDVVEEVAERVQVDAPETRSDLPIADFDNVSLGSLRARLRSLSVPDLVQLREWEHSHGHRLAVLTLLENRIAKLAAEAADDEGTPNAYPADPQSAS